MKPGPKPQPRVTATEKRCPRCDQVLPAAAFYRDASAVTGLSSSCRACHNRLTSDWSKRNAPLRAAHARARRAAHPENARAISRAAAKQAYARNPEKWKARTKAWYEANTERAAAYHRARREREAEKLADYLADYYRANADQIKARVAARAERLKEQLRPLNSARAMRRIARKLNATPPWADHAAIRAIYEEAARLQAATGVPHHVDHIVPLQSRRVCGLHVPWNLRPLPGPENAAKGNRVWPDCPDDVSDRFARAMTVSRQPLPA